MKRTTNFSAGIFFFVIAIVAFAQDLPATHPFPEDAFSTRDLVAWSHLQTPQPSPKPLPVPDGQAAPRPDQQRTSIDAQLFVGKIIINSGTYALRVADSIYRLDGDVDSRVENQMVRVLGSRDANGTIHILKIERLS
ncbi:MAG: hypothetical protein ACRD3B_12290 [Candidatus Sulfotelmatobacter sp.]